MSRFLWFTVYIILQLALTRSEKPE